MLRPNLPPELTEKPHTFFVSRREHLAHVNGPQISLPVHKPPDVRHPIPSERPSGEIGHPFLDHQAAQPKCHFGLAGIVSGQLFMQRLLALVNNLTYEDGAAGRGHTSCPTNP